MEKEFDLRSYLRALAQRWQLILICAFSFAIITALIVLLSPESRRAQADIFIVPHAPKLTLNENYAENNLALVTTQANQRQAIIDLGTSRAIEIAAAKRLDLESQPPGALSTRIAIRSDSDMIKVIATAPTQEEATALAEAWAIAYQEQVAKLYGSSSVQVVEAQANLDNSKQRFEQVQNEIDSFYASGELIRATYEVTRLTGLLLGGTEAQISLYTQKLSQAREMGQILENARTLQAQYEAGAQGNLGTAIAALMVRARLAGGNQLPVQLSFASAESLAQSEAASADLGRFITVLEAEHQRMVDLVEGAAKDLAAGNSTKIGLDPQTRNDYEVKLAIAHAAMAHAKGTELRLLQDRELALNALSVLQNRFNELQIEQSLAQVNFQIIDISPQPPPSRLLTLLLNTIIAAIAGLLLGVVFVLAPVLARGLIGAARPNDSAQPAGDAVSHHPSSD